MEKLAIEGSEFMETLKTILVNLDTDDLFHSTDFELHNNPISDGLTDS